MAKLMHSSVVGVFDFGSTSAGQLYIVMEYVDGTDVSQMIRSQKKLPPEHALAITAHVCDALSAAHELGIVHRDIKPANVLINMKGQVKVADFGLAKIDDPGSHGLTKTGYAMGTPDFVAPEALMLGTAVDGRADLYAVGVMLYQMLTGQIPRGAWQPASVLSPGTDPRFDQIILKAMQYDREARYQSSTELRQALDTTSTVPLVKQDAPAAAVVAAEVAQVPAQRSAAQKPQPRSRAPTRLPASNQAGEGTRAPVPPAKSQTPLFIGLGAAAVIAIGAFVMFSGKLDVARLSKVESAPPPAPKPSALESQATAKSNTATQPTNTSLTASASSNAWVTEAKKRGGKLRVWGAVDGKPIAEPSSQPVGKVSDMISVALQNNGLSALRMAGGAYYCDNLTAAPPIYRELPNAVEIYRGFWQAPWLNDKGELRNGLGLAKPYRTYAGVKPRLVAFAHVAGLAVSPDDRVAFFSQYADGTLKSFPAELVNKARSIDGTADGFWIAAADGKLLWVNKDWDNQPNWLPDDEHILESGNLPCGGTPVRWSCEGSLPQRPRVGKPATAAKPAQSHRPACWRCHVSRTDRRRLMGGLGTRREAGSKSERHRPRH